MDHENMNFNQPLKMLVQTCKISIQRVKESYCDDFRAPYTETLFEVVINLIMNYFFGKFKLSKRVNSLMFNITLYARQSLPYFGSSRTFLFENLTGVK